jgi:hypothetical protein
MQRFGRDGGRLDVTMDLSPEERNWLASLKELARSVLDYEAGSVEALLTINADIRLILDYGYLDIDRVIQLGMAFSVGRASFRPASLPLVGGELTFWRGIHNGVQDVLDGRIDFLKFFGALTHDVTYINNYEGYYWRASGTTFLPIVQQWGERRDARIVGAART